jgi:hypothetical protein
MIRCKGGLFCRYYHTVNLILNKQKFSWFTCIQLIHIEHQKLRNIPQEPLSLRFSGVNPDTSVKGQPTAH